MSITFQTRTMVEAALAHKNPSALSPRPREAQKSTACGFQPIDALLRGGLPCGSITELVGVNCSGRTSAALAYLAAITQASNVCAWVDVADALDPECVAANGVDLERLLWVRCSGKQGATVQAPQETMQSALRVVSASEPRHTGGGGGSSPHPRSEGRDMPEAISAMFNAHGGLYDKQARREKRGIGTPGAPNRQLSSRSEHREEQVNSDRLPARRGENLSLAPRCAEPQPRRTPQRPSGERMEFSKRKVESQQTNKPWQSLDQALRATDLLLQGGGFTTIVLDLGNVAPEIAWRIPLATWFRFGAACKRTRVSLLLLTQHSCARSSAGLVVRLHAASMIADNRVMAGIRYRGEAERSRTTTSSEHHDLTRKPPQSEHMGEWISEAAWAQAK